MPHDRPRRARLLHDHGGVRMNPAFSPRDLAEHWQCSERHVRNLIRDGKLRAFRLGGKLVRVPREAVEDFEKCESIAQSGIEKDGTPSGIPMTVSGAASLSGQPFALKWQTRSQRSKRIARRASAQGS